MNIEESEKETQSTSNVEKFLTSADPLELEQAYKNFESIQGSMENFVDSNIKYMQQYLYKEISPDREQLQEAYYHYMPIYFTLQKLYARCKSDLKVAANKKQLFEDQAYVATYNSYGGLDQKKTTSTLSDKKIEALYRYKYRNHLSVLQAEYDLADARRSCIERLLNTWDKYGYVLSNLAQMNRTETRSLGGAGAMLPETNWAQGYNTKMPPSYPPSN